MKQLVINSNLTRQQEYFIEKCFINEIRIIKTLVKYKVDYTISNYWGYRIASTKGYIELLSYLLSLNPNRKSLAESRILAWTAAAGQLKTVNCLLNDGDYYSNDSSALQWTAEKGDVKMMELLLGYCKNFNWIVVSAVKSEQLEMIDFLLDNEMEKYDINFNLAFNNAILHNKKKAADLLVNRGYFNKENVDSDIWEKYINLK